MTFQRGSSVIRFFLLLLILSGYYLSDILMVMKKLKFETEKRNENIIECKRNVSLAEKGTFPFVFLASFPGSGNTWIRMLIEDATGYYTGSKYDETALYNKGFIGELEDPMSGTTVCAKNHGRTMIEHAKGVILLVRNPYDAILAEFNRKHGHAKAHVGLADKSLFKTDLWRETMDYQAHRWSQMHEFYAVLTLDEHIPTHIIYFDNLVSNSTKEMESLLNFFNQNFGFYPEDAPKRLDCLNKINADNFHRKKKAPVSDSIYNAQERKSLNHHIKLVQKLFQTSDLQPMPDYFKPVRLQYQKITDDELNNATENMRNLWHKIKQFGSSSE